MSTKWFCILWIRHILMTRRMTPFTGRRILEICNIWWITLVSVLWENSSLFELLRIFPRFCCPKISEDSKAKENISDNKMRRINIKEISNSSLLEEAHGWNREIPVQCSHRNPYSPPIKMHNYFKHINDAKWLSVWFWHWEPDITTGFKGESGGMNTYQLALGGIFILKWSLYMYQNPPGVTDRA